MEKKFIEMFKEIIEEDGPVGLDDILQEFEEWDSLASLSLVSMVDDEYGVTLRSEDLEEVVVVGDVLELIKNKMG